MPNFRFDKAKLVAALDVSGILHPTGCTVARANQVDSLEKLLDYIAADDGWKCLPQVAYFLATIAWETGVKHPKCGKIVRTFSPVNETGTVDYFNKLYDGRKDLGNIEPGDGALFHGRGFLQTTGRGNYEKSGQVVAEMVLEEGDLPESFTLPDGITLPFTFTASSLKDYPSLLLIPRVSYFECSQRLRNRKLSYTGKILDDYIHSDKDYDFLNARKCVNGTDKAGAIAELAKSILAALKISPAQEEAPIPTEADPASLPPVVPTPTDQLEVDPAEKIGAELQNLAPLPKNWVEAKDKIGPLAPYAKRVAPTILGWWGVVHEFIVGLTPSEKIALALGGAVLFGALIYGYVALKNSGYIGLGVRSVKRWIKSSNG